MYLYIPPPPPPPFFFLLFLFCLFVLFLKENLLVLIRWTKWLTTPACPNQHCIFLHIFFSFSFFLYFKNIYIKLFFIFIKGNIEGTNSKKLCLMLVHIYMYVLLCLTCFEMFHIKTVFYPNCLALAVNNKKLSICVYLDNPKWSGGISPLNCTIRSSVDTIRNGQGGICPLTSTIRSGQGGICPFACTVRSSVDTCTVQSGQGGI